MSFEQTALYSHLRTNANPSSKWIMSPLADMALLMAGWWVYPALYLILGVSNQSTLNWFLTICIVLFSGAHSIGPILSVFLNPRLRFAFLKDRLYVAVFVGIILCSIPLGYFSGTRLDPGLLMLLASVYFVASTWHLSSQNYGIMSAYRLKADEKDPLLQKWDFWLCAIHGSILFPLVWWVAGLRQGQMLSEPISFGSEWSVFLRFLLAIFLLIGVGLALRTRSWPRFLMVIMLAAQGYICLRANVLIYGVTLYINHWIAELTLLFIVNGYSDLNQPILSWGKFWKYFSIIMIVGILGHQWLNDRLTFWVIEFDPQPWIRYVASRGGREVAGLFLGFGLAVRLSHFLMDRFIFRSRGVGRIALQNFLSQ